MTTAAQPHHRENDFAEEHHVYEPHLVGLPPLVPYVREAWRRRSFAFELSRTKLRAQHFNTVFGQLWLVLNPLLLAGVYFILVDILRGGGRGEDFFAHLWRASSPTTSSPTRCAAAPSSVVSGGRLILNTAFPRVLLPLASVIIAFKRFLPTRRDLRPGPPRARAAGRAGAAVGRSRCSGCSSCSRAGLAMIVAALQVYFRDLKNFMPYLLRVWLYGSPVLYYADEMPEQYRFLLDVNPLGQLLAAWSDVINLGQVADRPPAGRRRRVGVRLPDRRLPLLRLAGA